MKRQTQLIAFDREYREFGIALGDQLRAPRPLPLILNGLAAGAADALVAETVRTEALDGRPSILFVCEEKDGRLLCESLREAGLRGAFFPRRDLLFDFVSASHDTERERLAVLSAWMRGDLDALVTTPPAALQYTIPPAELQRLSVTLTPGTVIPPADLARRLSDMGYVASEVVEGAGQFSTRGGIIDVFGHGGAPVRVEFFDDEVDRMGFFDPETQRVFENCPALTLCPASEVLLEAETAARLALHVKGQRKKAPTEEAARILGAEIAALEGGTELFSRDKYIRAVWREAACLLDYADRAPLPVFLIGSSEMAERTRAALEMEQAQAVGMVEAGLVSGKYASYSATESDLDAFLGRHVPVYLNQFSGVSSVKVSGGLFGFRCRHTASYRDNFKQLCEDLGDYRRSLYRVLILCPHASEVEPLLRSLESAGLPATAIGDDSPLTDETLPLGSIRVGVGICRTGYDLPNPKAALLNMGEDNASPARKKKRTPRRKMAAGEAILSTAELRPGDLVVHETYGIGRFLGIRNMRKDGVSRDYISIQYAGGDSLFVPADRLECISKYIGAGSEDGTAKLSRMGSPEWARAKAHAKGAAKELARDLIALYAARQKLPGFAFPPDSDLEREFDDAFEFEETAPQLEAVEEIKADMMKPVPMDRLLCGDVGFGKTEVALRAAFKAICAGKQVALLVPTTILALQHFQTALSRMRGFPVTVDMLSGFRTAGEQTRILRALKRGDIDLLVGTHSLLSRRVEWKDLGLLIVDEEQRFGVAQKERLKQIAQNVDVLTLSATPIPRTLHMAMSGIRDMSLLDEAPVDRLPVQTYVTEHDDELIWEAIRRELRRGGQVLYLYNRTDNIALWAARISRAVPDARVTWAHGQMDKGELEQIWQSLVRGEIDVLVCTTIVETGVDLPNANTLIIEDADRMGLAQLHQLRGRVGRSGRRAYAYFTFRRGKALSEVATKRLEAIREYAAFGAGFRIAMKDLEIRGAGNLLGPEQHGNIESVGYDLYVRLLQEAILEERGQKPEPPAETTVDIRADALIPEFYIPSGALRMDMYKKISHIATPGDRTDVLDEFCDRFGEPPVQVLRLLDVALARALGARHGITRIEQREGELVFRSSRPDLAVWSELFSGTEGLSVRGGMDVYISLRLRRGEEPTQRAAEVMSAYAEAAERPAEEASGNGKTDEKQTKVGKINKSGKPSGPCGQTAAGGANAEKTAPAPHAQAEKPAHAHGQGVEKGTRTSTRPGAGTPGDPQTIAGLPKPARAVQTPRGFFGTNVPVRIGAGASAPADMYGTGITLAEELPAAPAGNWPGIGTTGSSSGAPQNPTPKPKRRGRPPKAESPEQARRRALPDTDLADVSPEEAAEAPEAGLPAGRPVILQGGNARENVPTPAPKRRGRPPKNGGTGMQSGGRD